MVSDINVGLVVPIIDATIAAANILRNRHSNIKDMFSICFILNRCEVEWRIHLVFAINRRYKFFFDLIDLVILNSENFSVVFHAEENVTAITVGKGTDSLIDIFRDLCP